MYLFSSIRGKILLASRNESLSAFVFDQSRKISYSSPLAIHMTPLFMFPMPTKRKRRLDPMIIKAREDKKRKKIEKEIRHVEKTVRIEKPSEEWRIPLVLYKDPESRARNIKMTKEEEIESIMMSREYSRAKLVEAKNDLKEICDLVLSAQIALKELRKVSEDLYQAAIKIDDNLIPFTFEGPKESPSIKGYKKHDGDYINISKKWNSN